MNCYNHDDPKLIRALKEKIIHPPSKLGKRQHVNISILIIIEYQDFSERSVPFHKRQSQFQQDVFLDQVIFQGRVKDGFFIEAGADDFLDGTNSLMLEEKYNWTGLLVEPNPVRFHLGYEYFGFIQSESNFFKKSFKKYFMNLEIFFRLKSNRKVWSASTCFSINNKPNFFQIDKNLMDGMGGIVPPNISDGSQQSLQCFPLYSFLLALDSPTVNLLSLDIEGAEFEVSLDIEGAEFEFSLNIEGLS